MQVNRPKIKTALAVVGAWLLSKLISFVITALLLPISNRLTFMGEVGNVAMWLWQGFPEALAAALAAVVVVWILEANKPLLWVGVLAALYLYSGSLQAWRLITLGWHTPPRSSDYVGILAQSIIPVVVCLIVGYWRVKHSDSLKLAAT